MISYLEELQKAKQHGYAIGAFNIFNHLSARAVIRAAEKLDSPVILQTSVQTVKAFGVQELGRLLRGLASQAETNVMIHLDHCREVELAMACMDAGWDSVMYDGSDLPLAENIAMTKAVVAYARPRGICVEGELGRIAGVEDDLNVDAEQTVGISLADSVCYVKETGVDAFAPAIGTAHGAYHGAPLIDFALVEVLKDKIDAPIVIHGGTGLEEDTFRRLIRSGGAKVNVSTAMKQSYLDGCKTYLRQYPDKLDPLALDRYLDRKIGAVAGYHIDLFRKAGR